MATRGVMQMTKLRMVYCEHGGSSTAIRDYIRSGRIVEWAKQHPHVEVAVQIRNGNHPYIQGIYRTGSPKQITVKNETLHTIQKVVDMLKNSSGRKIKRLSEPVITATPSIQGIWTPMLNLQETPFPIKIVETSP